MKIILSFLLFSTVVLSQDARPAGGIARVVQSAKRQGKSQITFVRTDTNFRPAPTTLKAAFSDTTVIVATPLQSIVTVGQDTISTWIKYRVTQYVKQQPPWDFDPLPEWIPKDLLPVQGDEIIVLEGGGVAVIDGVKVIQIWEGDHG